MLSHTPQHCLYAAGSQMFVGQTQGTDFNIYSFVACAKREVTTSVIITGKN